MVPFSMIWNDTYDPDCFKGTPLIVHKQYAVEEYLQWNTNRNFTHALFNGAISNNYMSDLEWLSKISSDTDHGAASLR